MQYNAESSFLEGAQYNTMFWYIREIDHLKQKPHYFFLYSPSPLLFNMFILFLERVCTFSQTCSRAQKHEIRRFSVEKGKKWFPKYCIRNDSMKCLAKGGNILNWFTCKRSNAILPSVPTRLKNMYSNPPNSLYWKGWVRSILLILGYVIVNSLSVTTSSNCFEDQLWKERFAVLFLYFLADLVRYFLKEF